MLDKSGLEKLAITIPIDYGDTITKKDLIAMFEIDQSHKHRDNITFAEYEKASEAAAWEFLSCMDIFRIYLRELRSMHLEALGRQNTYRVIRPDQHVAVALGHLRKSIEKGFSKAHDILDATAEDLLEAAEKVALSNAQIKVARLESLVLRSQAKLGVFDSFANYDAKQIPKKS